MKKLFILTLALAASLSVNAQKIDTLLNIYGASPIDFSVKVPDGNYRVTVTLGSKKRASQTVVRAESRRHYSDLVTTKKGKFQTVSFIVNKHEPMIDAKTSVKLKEREITYKNWNDVLDLQFCGPAPAVQRITIEPDTTAVTVFLCGNSTVVDQEKEPWASWGQMITRWFDNGVVIANYAESGLSCTSFLAQLRLDKILSQIRKGDYVICLDDDGQTPANEVGKLLAALEGDADAVYARYGHKQHNLFRNFGTAMNEWMASVMLGKPRDLFVSSYFGVRRFVVEEMVKYESSYPYVIGLVLRSTKNIVNVDVNHRKREVGTSGYTFAKLLGLWINGFTAFSIKPLRIATLSGSIFACLGFIYGIYTIIKKFVNPNVPVGFSAMMSAIIFIGGMVMLMLGMVGEYLGRVYISQNKNPQYVIRETTSQKEE